MTRDKARELRQAFEKKYATLARELNTSQDEKFPKEYRDREKERLTQQLAMVESQYRRQMLIWGHAERTRAAVLRNSDPVQDAATETRRLRQQMEINALAEQFKGRTLARNYLLPEARRFIELGLWDKAGVYLEAAIKNGAHDGRAVKELNAIKDEQIPERKRAIAIEQAVAEETRDMFLSIDTLKVDNKIGSRQEQVRASTGRKLREWQKREGLIAVPTGGAGAGAPAEGGTDA